MIKFKAIIVLAFSCMCMASYAFEMSQDSLSIVSSSINWIENDTNYTEEYKLNQINLIQDEFMSFYENFPGFFEKDIDNFHMLDVNIDGRSDIVYIGDAGTEARRTIIFLNQLDGLYKSALKANGVLIKLSQNTWSSPYSLTILELPCCDDVAYYIKTYNKPTRNISSDYVLTEVIEFSKTISLPRSRSFISKFQITNDTALLRHTPSKSIDNIVANYDSGSFGYALASENDLDGTTWFFVIIHNMDSHSNNRFKNCRTLFVMGWFSEQDIELLSKTAIFW